MLLCRLPSNSHTFSLTSFTILSLSDCLFVKWIRKLHLCPQPSKLGGVLGHLPVKLCSGLWKPSCAQTHLWQPSASASFRHLLCNLYKTGLACQARLAQRVHQVRLVRTVSQAKSVILRRSRGSPGAARATGKQGPLGRLGPAGLPSA